MALSAQTKLLIDKLIRAAKEEAFKGTHPPEERNALERRLSERRKALEDHIMDLL